MTNDFLRFPAENKLRRAAPGRNFEHVTNANQSSPARFKETLDFGPSFKPYPLSGIEAVFRTHERRTIAGYATSVASRFQ